MNRRPCDPGERTTKPTKFTKGGRQTVLAFMVNFVVQPFLFPFPGRLKT
jgi:hypothetical protein